MDLFESRLDTIIHNKTQEANALLEVKAEAKELRAAEKAAAIDSGTVIDKPKRIRAKKTIN